MANVSGQELGGETVLTASLEAMAIVDDDQYLAVNDEYATLYGLTDPVELEGDPWRDRFPPEARTRLDEEILPTCRTEGHWNGIISLQGPGEEGIDHRLSIASLDDGRFLFTIRETDSSPSVTDQVTSQDQLLEHVFDAMDDIVYVLDSDGDSCLYWNEQLCAITGYTDEEIAEIDPADLIAADQHDAVPGFTTDIEDLEDQHVELDIVTKDGETIPHEFRGTTFHDPETGQVYRCGIARDIRQRLEREEQLQRERDRFAVLFENVPTPVMYGPTSGDGPLIEDVNPAFEAVFGVEAENIRGQSLDDLIVPDDVDNEDLNTRIIEERGLEAEVRRETADGIRDFLLQTAIVPLDDPIDEFPYEGWAMYTDITERKERERELEAARQFNQELVENAPFGMFRLDEDLRITYENPRAEEIIGLPDDKDESDAIGVDIRDLPPIVETGQASLFSKLKHGETIDFEFPFESIYDKEAYFTGRAVPLYREGEFDGAILMATDISERRQRERELERHRDELATLNRINDLHLEITRDLFASPTRLGIEQTVCEQLGDSDLYKFAWIGAPEPGGDTIVPHASGGIDEGYIESITITTDAGEQAHGPGGRAYRTGELQVSQDIRSDPDFEPWRDAALERDIQSAAAVPLVHDDIVYGVLAVYSTRPLAFSEREQEGFVSLGKAIGFAINAIEHRKLLFADSVVELEFDVSDSDLVFVRVSEELNCTLTITGVVRSASGNWSVYVAAEDASPTTIRDLAREADDVESVRVIADEGDGGLLEFVMPGPALSELSGYGAILTSGTVTRGEGRFSIEAPQSADIHQLTERLQETLQESSLVAQREFDRPAKTAGEIRQTLDDQLTDRQLEALERAYHAGYFDWPRTSTAGSVAESMDVAETTFHYHLRHALETLLMALLELEDQR